MWKTGGCVIGDGYFLCVPDNFFTKTILSFDLSSHPSNGWSSRKPW